VLLFWINVSPKSTMSTRELFSTSRIMVRFTAYSVPSSFFLNSSFPLGLTMHDLSTQLDHNLLLSADYGKRSGGQRRRTDLALFFGLLVRSLRSYPSAFSPAWSSSSLSVFVGTGSTTQSLQVSIHLFRWNFWYSGRCRTGDSIPSCLEFPFFLESVTCPCSFSSQDAVQRFVTQLSRRIRKVFVVTHSGITSRSGNSILVISCSSVFILVLFFPSSCFGFLLR
jgi:hypothetical protein